MVVKLGGCSVRLIGAAAMTDEKHKDEESDEEQDAEG